MRDLKAAGRALHEAEASNEEEIARSVWLAKAADYAVMDVAVLVGGAAVNLHTGSYRPTDVDLCAFLGEDDRQAMIDVGFRNTEGDHFSYSFADDEMWLLEFPDSQVDGDVAILQLSERDSLAVITPESLMVDRLLQATDGTNATFDDAVRLGVALIASIDWEWVSEEIARRDALEPGLEIRSVYHRVRKAFMNAT